MIPDAVLRAVIEVKNAREATRMIAGVQDQLEEATKAANLATAAVNRFGRVRGIAVLDVDAAKARAQTAAATKEVNGFGATHATATADLDIGGVVTSAREATAAVNGFDHEHATATLEANGNGVTHGVEQATAEVRVFGQLTAEARADLKIAGAVAKISQLRALLADLGAQDATVEVQVKAAKAVADLERAEGALAKMRAEVARSGQSVGGLSKEFDGLRSSKRETDKLIDKNVGTFGGLSSAVSTASASTSGMSGSVGFLTSGLSGLQFAALLVGVALLAVLGPAVAVAAALAPLVGLAAGAAGGLAAAAQGFGVFKLATVGVLDALKEQVKQSGASGAAAISQAGQEQAAARAISAAMEGVRSAREGVRRASEALSNAERQETQAIAALGPAYQQARRHIQDLGSAVIDSAISLKEVRLRAVEARQALADLLGGPSPRQLADAHQAVSDAVRGETTAVRELVSAQQALNDLLAPADVLSVADAQDAVADAMRGQTHAANDLADQAKATNAVLNDPASTADEKARAQLALADAQNAVGDAARATEHAQRALNQLQAPPTADAVAAAKGRIADAEANVAKATLASRDAADALAKTQAGASSADIAKARLDVAAAEQAVSKATLDSARSAADYQAAQKAGIAHAPEVLAAREALRSATQAAANADRGLTSAEHQLVLAQQGVSNAQADAARSSAGLAASATDLNQKFNALPPSAQHFVRTLISMKGKADELRKTAAAGFFPGAEAGLIAAARNFEPVKKVVGQTSSVLGDLAHRAGELVGSSAFGKDIETIGGRNAKVLDTMGQATLHIVSALRHLLISAGPLTQWLADTANAWALSAAESAKAGRETGRTAAFFERTRAVLERLGSIVGHVAHGLFGVGKAGTDSGNNILVSIDRAAKRFDEWANSVGGQAALKDFFQRTKDLAAALVPAIANVAKGFGILTLRLLPVTDALRLLGPYADEAVIAFVAWKLAITAVRIVAVAWNATAAISAFVTGGWTTAFWALNAAMAANPIGIVVLAIAALAAGLIYAYTKVTWFHDAVDSAFSWIKDHWPLLLAILTGPIGLAVVAIATYWDQITGAAGAAWEWMRSTAVTLWNLIGLAITTPISAASTALGAIWEIVKAAASIAWGVLKAAADIAWAAIKLAITAPIEAAKLIVGGVWTGIQTAAVTAWALIKGAADIAWGGIKAAVTGPIDAAKNIVGGVWDTLSGDAATAWVGIKKGIGGFATDVKDAIEGAFKGAANLVIDFVNEIIKAINLIPGVPNIGLIKKLAEGGTHGGPGAAAGGAAGASVRAMAHGGAFARTGGYVNQPITLMGEEAPRMPEWVIPENPSYRKRALALWQAAGARIGALATGGTFASTSYGPPWGGIQGTGVTATGVDLRGNPHVLGVAVDPSVIKLGSMLKATPNPFGTTDKFKAFDTGGAIKGNRLDFYDWRGRDAQLGWGRRNVSVDVASGGGGILGTITGAVGSAVSSVTGIVGDLLSKGAGFLLDQLPGTNKLPDWLKGTGKYLIDHVGDWIKDKVAGLVGGGGGGGGGPTSSGGPTGVGTFEGVPMANWVIEALNYGRAHGAHGHPTSGYRPGFDPHTASGRSEHQGTQYPHGAVDFGGYNSGLAEKMSYVAATRGFKWPLLAPIGFHDDGHASGTGHYMGGVYGGVLGSYAAGTDWVPRTGPYLLHEGEGVTPRGQNSGAPTVHVIFEGMPEELQKLIRVEIEQDGRRSHQAWNAGVLP